MLDDSRQVFDNDVNTIKAQTYGGISRLSFFLLHFVIYILPFLLIAPLIKSGYDIKMTEKSVVLLVIFLSLLPFFITIGSIFMPGIATLALFSASVLLISTVILVVLTMYRYKNMGYKAIWGVAITIPIFNLIPYMRCLVYPTGYADSQQLDTTGKIIGAVLLFLMIVVVILEIRFLIY